MPGGLGEGMARVRGGRGFGGAEIHRRSVGGIHQEVQPAVAIDVRDAERRVAPIVLVEGHGIGEHGSFAHRRRFPLVDGDCLGLGLGPHAHVRESRQPGCGVRFEALVVREQLRRLALAPGAPQRLGAGPIGAAEIRVEFRGAQKQRGGGSVLALLQERLAEEVEGIGVPWVAGGRALEHCRGGFGFAKIEMHDAARVKGPQVSRLAVEHLAQDGERQPFVAFLLPIQGGDGLVHPSIQPVRRQCESGNEGSLRLGILIAPHEGNAAVIARHGLVGWRSRFPAAAGPKAKHQCRRQRGAGGTEGGLAAEGSAQGELLLAEGRHDRQPVVGLQAIGGSPAQGAATGQGSSPVSTLVQRFPGAVR